MEEGRGARSGEAEEEHHWQQQRGEREEARGEERGEGRGVAVDDGGDEGVPPTPSHAPGWTFRSLLDGAAGALPRPAAAAALAFLLMPPPRTLPPLTGRTW